MASRPPESGKRFVQTFSLKTPPEASQPCLFADLMKLDCDAILCSAWRPKSTTAARKEIDQQEKFTGFFKNRGPVVCHQCA